MTNYGPIFRKSFQRRSRKGRQECQLNSHGKPKCNSLIVAFSFLLVSLNMDAILGEITLSRRRKKLVEMTKGDGLGGAYTETLSRIQAQPESQSKPGMEVLMWVSHAERPLHVDELCHALGVEGSSDLDIGNILPAERLLACSLGLVVVEESSSTVRLIHYTLQEYLSNNTSLFPNPHSVIAGVCLTYLNFPHVRGFSPALRSVPPTAPFVEYASCYWGTHAKLETTESVKTLALKLLNGYEKHISSKLLLLHRMGAEEQPLGTDDTPRGFTGLHGAAYFGCVVIIVALLETNKVDVQATDFRGNFAIAWASRMGHEAVVRVLLERSDDTPGSDYGSAPLVWAAESGHEGVVRMLLERNDVNLTQGRFGRAPLGAASEKGHEGVVKMLLKRNDVNPNKGLFGNTPCFAASEEGHEGVVKMLLERNDINPNQRGIFGETPLGVASRRGHEGIVKMLLGRNDVNPNKRDIVGQTPLMGASSGGHEGIVKMLLEWNDVDPNKGGIFGETPLGAASREGHEAVVRMLLERNDVDPNKGGIFGETPLVMASEEGIVKMLLERNDINPNQRGMFGETPLGAASRTGHEGIVKILLERNDVDLNQGFFRQTPLGAASGMGHEGIVKMLLERNDVDPNQAFFGETPLWAASVKGHEGVVKMLLERNDVDPHAPVLYWFFFVLSLRRLISVSFLIYIVSSYLKVSKIELVFICTTIWLREQLD